jgi:SLT domain-containing protein
MATVAAAPAGIVSTIAGTNYGGGRQYGGPVSADSYYRVNETGRPEMFTAANGSQYMLPTKGGSITPASEVGAGGVQWRIIINNNAASATASASVDDSSRTVTIAVNEVASQISERRGPVWSAMRTTSVQGRPA